MHQSFFRPEWISSSRPDLHVVHPTAPRDLVLQGGKDVNFQVRGCLRTRLIREGNGCPRRGYGRNVISFRRESFALGDRPARGSAPLISHHTSALFMMRATPDSTRHLRLIFQLVRRRACRGNATAQSTPPLRPLRRPGQFRSRRKRSIVHRHACSYRLVCRTWRPQNRPDLRQRRKSLNS